MQSVIQGEATGCGIASVANILGKSYAQVNHCANAMGIYATDRALWSDTQYVRRLLAAFEVNTAEQEQPFSSWEELPELALLAIKHHQEEGINFWHWVVFKRAAGLAAVLDSASYLLENVRTDFDEMQPKWFIEVRER
ncbi:MAG: hypothetical protein ACJAWL_002905 [Motiliproteus sp.]|jgi:hypothetical protein